jgi:prepilin-type N-terminal cleavage/methylation domain-containing protein
MEIRRMTARWCVPSGDSKVRAQFGFTLIELLITMAIMAILTAAMTYVMAGAQESAKIAKTRSLIARLHGLVMQKYESYRYRRLPVAIPSGLSPQDAAKVRCDVIRQLMRLEMPDRWTDVTDKLVRITIPATGAKIDMQPPACSQAYRAFYRSVVNTAAFQKNGIDHQGAKCLYLLVTMGLEDNDERENFSEGDIADFDKTGCKVFLDAWGNPIEYLRWAPGFVSPLQPAQPGTHGIPATARDLRMPDQTDPMGVYGAPQSTTTAAASKKPDTFALYPLIYSAGPDGNYDVVPDIGNVGSGTGVLQYSNPPNRDAWTNPANNPYVGYTNSDPTNFPDGPIGSPAVFPQPNPDVGSRSIGTSDNIHNHTIGAR